MILALQQLVAVVVQPFPALVLAHAPQILALLRGQLAEESAAARLRALRRRRRLFRRRDAGIDLLAARDRHLRSVAQAVAAVGHHGFADIESLDDGNAVALLRAERHGAHRHHMVGLDHEDISAARAALNRGSRHHGLGAQRVDQKTYIDELIGEQRAVRVVEERTQLDRAGRRVDLGIHRREPSGGELCRLAAVVGGHGEHGAALHARNDVADIVLGDGEEHGHRLKLGDDNHARRLSGADEVADIDLAQPRKSRYRRDNARIAEIDGGGFDVGPVGQHHALVLLDQGGLRGQHLLRDRVRGVKRLIAPQIDARVGKQGAVARELPPGLIERRLEAARIDFGKKIARFHELAFLKCDAPKLAAHLRPDGDGRQRRDRAKGVQGDVDVAFGGLGDAHGLRAARAEATLIAGVLTGKDRPHEKHEQDEPENDPHRAFAARQVFRGPASDVADDTSGFIQIGLDAVAGTVEMMPGCFEIAAGLFGGGLEAVRLVALACHAIFQCWLATVQDGCPDPSSIYHAEGYVRQTAEITEQFSGILSELSRNPLAHAGLGRRRHPAQPVRPLEARTDAEHRCGHVLARRLAVRGFPANGNRRLLVTRFRRRRGRSRAGGFLARHVHKRVVRGGKSIHRKSKVELLAVGGDDFHFRFGRALQAL